MKFEAILAGLYVYLRYNAWRYPQFRDRLREQDLVAQIRIRNQGIGRWFQFSDGTVRSRAGIREDAAVSITYESAAIGAELLTPPADWLRQVSAAKNFDLRVQGEEAKAYWFAQVLWAAQRTTWRAGTDRGHGVTRYTSMTNGGPCFVYVKDGKILRITPIDFDRDDARPWTIHARGKAFTPPHKATLSVHGLASKSLVYSPDRLLHPMKRVDFDPAGERNPSRRGISGYVRISWDEALDLVATEIKRVRGQHGEGAMLVSHPSHHSWGNIGYYLSSLYRFANVVGHTRVQHNPDSWEGWFWGALHHWGYSMRLGLPEAYSTVEDLLRDAELVVFWSSDPEATSGCYAGHEGTIRRQWLLELGIPTIHIDPYYNHTAAYLRGKWIAPRPGTDTAMALAIAWVWVTEGLYDTQFVEQRTYGFDKWKAYLLGAEDGVAKTPQWQETETGVAARVVRALARQWGRSKTYLGAGGMGSGLGGACRGPTGHQWARAMVCLAAMQGMGRAGVNFGNLQFGTPIDLSFYFPGYAEGGISGDLMNTANAINLYQRMPHLLTMNTPLQQIPRLQLPEAILHGKAEGYLRDGRQMEGQFVPVRYPVPGHAPVRMLYRYGGSNFGVIPDGHRHMQMYRSENLEFVVNQSVWLEGEAKFADVILPACTSFERWDISEWANLSGFMHHGQMGLNSRVVTLQHKCIEPLGESRSDYQIFLDLAMRLGLGAMFSEGMSELDWVKRMFDASDLPRHVKWKDFLRKGYFVVPPPAPNQRAPVALRWYYDGRPKDVPEPHPLPSEYKGHYLDGLQTPSGKFEFDCQTLQRFAPQDAQRPPVLHYVASIEGLGAERARSYPLQLLTPHPRYSFHTQSDGKGSVINQIEDHRMRIDGHDYWVLRIHPQDAAARAITDRSLVQVFNERGTVICAACITPRVRPGTVHGYESSARYEPLGPGDRSAERGGALNLLTNPRSQLERAHSMGSSNALVDVQPWHGLPQAATERQVAADPAWSLP